MEDVNSREGSIGAQACWERTRHTQATGRSSRVRYVGPAIGQCSADPGLPDCWPAVEGYGSHLLATWYAPVRGLRIGGYGARA